MKRKCLGTVLGLFVAAGLVSGQPPETPLSMEPDALRYLTPSGNGAPVPPPVDAVPGRSWFLTGEVEYLLWWLQSERLGGGLVSTDAQANTVLNALNNLGRDRENKPLSGGRFTLGYWLADFDPINGTSLQMPYFGVEFSGFFLGERSFDFLTGATPILFRPFFDVNNSANNGFVVSVPGIAAGQLSGSAKFDLWGTEANAWANIFNNPPSQSLRVDAMVGFRQLDFDGSVRVNQSTTFDQNPVDATFAGLAGSRLEAFDYFGVENHYYGAQVGMKAKLMFGPAIFEAAGKYGFGTVRQHLNIDGGQLLTAADGSRTRSTGGLLALPSNIGNHGRNRFAQVPEANFNLTFLVSERLSVHAGYTFLYFSRVLRAANQIDRDIDITQIPNFPGAAGAVPTGLGRPAVLFRESGLLVQGLNFGLTFAW